MGIIDMPRSFHMPLLAGVVYCNMKELELLNEVVTLVMSHSKSVSIYCMLNFIRMTNFCCWDTLIVCTVCTNKLKW